MDIKEIISSSGPYLAAIFSAIATFLATYFFEKQKQKQATQTYRKFLLENLSLILNKVVESLEDLKLSRNDKSYYPLEKVFDIENTKNDIFEISKNLVSIEDKAFISYLRNGMNDVYGLMTAIRFAESYQSDTRKKTGLSKVQINKEIEKLKTTAINYNYVYKEDADGGNPRFEFIGTNKKNENIELANYFILQLFSLRGQISNKDFEQNEHENEIERRRSLLLPQIVDAKSTVKEFLREVNQKLK